MTTFVTLIHRDLSGKIHVPLPRTASPPVSPGSKIRDKDRLRDYFVQSDSPTSHRKAQQSLQVLRNFGGDALVQASSGSASSEQDALLAAIAAKLTVGLYTQLLDIHLNEASEAESELEWWADVERSRVRAAYYLLQSESGHRSIFRARLTADTSNFSPSNSRFEPVSHYSGHRTKPKHPFDSVCLLAIISTTPLSNKKRAATKYAHSRSVPPSATRALSNIYHHSSSAQWLVFYCRG